MVQERRQGRAENFVEEPSAAYRRIPAALGKISTTMSQGQGWLSHNPLGGLGNSSLRTAKATECHCFYQQGPPARAIGLSREAPSCVKSPGRLLGPHRR